MTKRRGRTPAVFAGSVVKATSQTQRAPRRKFYAVRYGRDGFSGVLSSWEECTLYVTGIKGAVFKSFKTYAEAHAFASEDSESRKDDVQVQPSANPVNMGKDRGQVVGNHCTTNDTDENQFHVFSSEPRSDAPNKLCVYTDGACSRNGKAGSRAGYGVFFHDDSPYNVSEPLHGPPTNQRAEMTAALRALETVLQYGLVERGGIVELYTDSMYTKNGMDVWTSKWKRNNWKTAQSTDVKNKDLWVALDKAKDALRSLNIRLSVIWVKGHHGIPGNEAADRLAVGGMLRSE